MWGLYISGISSGTLTPPPGKPTHHHGSATSSSQGVKISIKTGEEMSTTNQAHIYQPSYTRAHQHQDTEEIIKEVVDI